MILYPIQTMMLKSILCFTACLLLISCDFTNENESSITQHTPLKKQIDSLTSEKQHNVLTSKIDSLQENKIYVLYTSDHEGPPIKSDNHFEIGTVYGLPPEYLKVENYSKGYRLSGIYYNQNPIWNKKGDEIAYLSFGGDKPWRDDGKLIIDDVSNDLVDILGVSDACTCGLSYDDSGNRLAFGKTKYVNGLGYGQRKYEVSIYDIKERRTTWLLKTEEMPHHLSISPNGKHIVFWTSDGIDEVDTDVRRPNLLNVETRELIKIGQVDDRIVTSANFLWYHDSSKVIFIGYNMNVKRTRTNFWQYWEYDLSTKKLKPYVGTLEGFQDQKVRYWDASKLDKNQKYNDPYR